MSKDTETMPIVDEDGVAYKTQLEMRKEHANKMLENYGMRDSYQTWKKVGKDVLNLEKIEDEVLSKLCIYPKSDDADIKAQILNTKIDYKVSADPSMQNYIHEFYIQNNKKGNTKSDSESKNKEVVMVHGYGASLGLFFKNFEGLSEIPGIKLHCLDLLGFGLSSRPKFPVREASQKQWFQSLFWKSSTPKEVALDPIFEIDNEYKVNTTLKDVENAENFFIDSLESWRKTKKIDNFTLIGHSLGGYLSCCYALKYPARVNKLVLVSPVGVETSIFDLENLKKYHEQIANESDGSSNKDQNKFIKILKNNNKIIKLDSETFHQNSIYNTGNKQTVLGPEVGKEFETTKNLENENEQDKFEKKKSSSIHVPNEHGHVEKIPNLPGFFKFLWARDMSPFSVLRSLGPLGPQLCGSWSFRRFYDLPDTESIMLMHEYAYGGFKMRGSGEHCLSRILGPGALAYKPLLNRCPKNLQCDSLWIYGDVDWMSKEAGKIMVDKINANNEYRKKADFEILENAGHHVYLDNAPDFNKLIKKFLNF